MLQVKIVIKQNVFSFIAFGKNIAGKEEMHHEILVWLEELDDSFGLCFLFDLFVLLSLEGHGNLSRAADLNERGSLLCLAKQFFSLRFYAIDPNKVVHNSEVEII